MLFNPLLLQTTLITLRVMVVLFTLPVIKFHPLPVDILTLPPPVRSVKKSLLL